MTETDFCGWSNCGGQVQTSQEEDITYLHHCLQRADPALVSWCNATESTCSSRCVHASRHCSYRLFCCRALVSCRLFDAQYLTHIFDSRGVSRCIAALAECGTQTMFCLSIFKVEFVPACCRDSSWELELCDLNSETRIAPFPSAFSFSKRNIRLKCFCFLYFSERKGYLANGCGAALVAWDTQARSCVNIQSWVRSPVLLRLDWKNKRQELIYVLWRALRL